MGRHSPLTEQVIGSMKKNDMGFDSDGKWSRT